MSRHIFVNFSQSRKISYQPSRVFSVYRGQTPVYAELRIVVSRCARSINQVVGCDPRTHRREGFVSFIRYCNKCVIATARRGRRALQICNSKPHTFPLEGKGDRLRWMRCVALTAQYKIVRRNSSLFT